ncbi:toxin YafO [Salmonella enterica]|jgi:mRNA interferase YafO|uniref:type II toxin-antitoxin system YafO family toxin n=1 Tax=Enterobacteriaceae TaxID=543 RepID=UPI0006514C6D|nr:MULTISPECIES: type II toxin-antitoxin system YafO family toxin [Citrobacter freundii complex]EAO3892642.1 toxin YafO [Salmonella enterica]EBS4044705.1 toxin YafO [Salmonella enterica subsp. enterica serovar Mikawasima]EDN4414460.1 toxin YafO [Salmonella enterica subsp. enterica serovar Mbandaka]EFG4520739.1 toxin YafO [Escherichia coli]EAT2369613.1 toxin YafO [Salmonella enterica]
MKVTWNSDSYDKYLAPTFKVRPDLKVSLLADFQTFKQGLHPAVFGKNEPYTAPHAIVTSRVYHVHLLFTKKDRNSSKKKFDCTSNSALVYTQHVKHPDVFSLLAIFPIDAHAKAKDNDIMVEIAGHAAAFQALTNP